jgi:hypothetical protein
MTDFLDSENLEDWGDWLDANQDFDFDVEYW